jgi:hypothetical protein
VQERFLSTRVIHFAQLLLLWQCSQTWLSESFPDGAPACYYRGFEEEKCLKSSVRKCQEIRSVSESPGQADKLLLSSPDDLLPEICDHWRNFISFYSKHELTQESDILVALHGISQHVVVDTLCDRTLAGLLESDFLLGLSWWSTSQRFTDANPGSSHRPILWRAPSWNWASTKCEIHYDRPGMYPIRPIRHDVARVVSCHVQQGRLVNW